MSEQTPSQAEGEREQGAPQSEQPDPPAQQTTPSQAEGEREDEDAGGTEG
ncbi:hypothetical protein ACFYOV_08620 [Streptomyces sp. NPDC005931]